MICPSSTTTHFQLSLLFWSELPVYNIKQQIILLLEEIKDFRPHSSQSCSWSVDIWNQKVNEKQPTTTQNLWEFWKTIPGDFFMKITEIMFSCYQSKKCYFEKSNISNSYSMTTQFSICSVIISVSSLTLKTMNKKHWRGGMSTRLI